MRPRDVIHFFNSCIDKSEGKAQFNIQVIREAEGEYSKGRLRFLFDEWYGDYPNLLTFIELLKKKPSHFSVSDFSQESLDNICFSILLTRVQTKYILYTSANEYFNTIIDVEDFKRIIVQIFFRVINRTKNRFIS